MVADTPASVIRRLSHPIAGRKVERTVRDESDERCLDHLAPLLASLQANEQKFQTEQTAD